LLNLRILNHGDLRKKIVPSIDRRRVNEVYEFHDLHINLTLRYDSWVGSLFSPKNLAYMKTVCNNFYVRKCHNHECLDVSHVISRQRKLWIITKSNDYIVLDSQSVTLIRGRARIWTSRRSRKTLGTFWLINPEHLQTKIQSQRSIACCRRSLATISCLPTKPRSGASQ